MGERKDINEIIAEYRRGLDKSEKIKKVCDILLTPIICDKRIPEIIIRDGKIISPQLYYGVADEDMSDFSIGFYKIMVLCQ